MEYEGLRKLLEEEPEFMFEEEVELTEEERLSEGLEMLDWQDD